MKSFKVYNIAHVVEWINPGSISITPLTYVSGWEHIKSILLAIFKYAGCGYQLEAPQCPANMLNLFFLPNPSS